MTVFINGVNDNEVNLTEVVAGGIVVKEEGEGDVTVIAGGEGELVEGLGVSVLEFTGAADIPVAAGEIEPAGVAEVDEVLSVVGEVVDDVVIGAVILLNLIARLGSTGALRIGTVQTDEAVVGADEGIEIGRASCRERV